MDFTHVDKQKSQFMWTRLTSIAITVLIVCGVIWQLPRDSAQLAPKSFFWQDPNLIPLVDVPLAAKKEYVAGDAQNEDVVQINQRMDETSVLFEGDPKAGKYYAFSESLFWFPALTKLISSGAGQVYDDDNNNGVFTAGKYTLPKSDRQFAAKGSIFIKGNVGYTTDFLLGFYTVNGIKYDVRGHLSIDVLPTTQSNGRVQGVDILVNKCHLFIYTVDQNLSQQMEGWTAYQYIRWRQNNPNLLHVFLNGRITGQDRVIPTNSIFPNEAATYIERGIKSVERTLKGLGYTVARR